jgi:hypothetical protein
MTKIWETVKSFFKTLLTWFLRYPAAIVITVFVITITLILIVYGKKIQIGGLLGKIWGKDINKYKQIARETIPVNRVDENGKPIQPGQSDTGGYVQAPVSTDIKESGILSDPNIVEIIDPEKGEVAIILPTGVKNSDVKEIIIIKPSVYEVKRNDGGVSIHELDDLIGKINK